LILEKTTNTVKIGGFSHIRSVSIGGGFPVVIQTMWKDRLNFSNLDEAVTRIELLGELGCSLLRVAIPDIQSADIVGRLAQMVSMPLVADVHFDYKIALRCLDFPIAKLRINPGNIGGKDKTLVILEKAAKHDIPIRIGINSGSLPADIRKKVEEGLDTSEALVQTAERELAVLEKFGYNKHVISMKTSTIADTIKANRILAGRIQSPIHLGVTEAGPLISGTVRNTAALITLLAEGIGNTIRVSLSGSMEDEVIAGKEILRAAAEITSDNKRLKCSGVKIVSCPRCGRHGFDTHSFTAKWMPRLYALDKDITIAIMGCEVNGLQEAKHADLGITGAGNKVLIFKSGKVIKTITSDQADAAFEEELNKVCSKAEN